MAEEIVLDHYWPSMYSRQLGIIGFLTRGSFEKRLRVLRSNRERYPELAEVYRARIDDVLRWQEVCRSPSEIEMRQGHLFRILDQVNAQLSKTPYLIGEEYSLADVAWTVMIARLKFMGLHHRLSTQSLGYYDRMRRRSSFKRAQIWEQIKPGVLIPIVAGVLTERLRGFVSGSNHFG